MHCNCDCSHDGFGQKKFDYNRSEPPFYPRIMRFGLEAITMNFDLRLCLSDLYLGWWTGGDDDDDDDDDDAMAESPSSLSSFPNYRSEPKDFPVAIMIGQN
uniref:Uncharacterized protein n=1 Tax=Lactuca sativa TaxID=4236 RepID=A0A9R1UQJ5_LACSA|nr:hypothetical protein LSAT_V11C800414280 [Lactuca sativa]